MKINKIQKIIGGGRIVDFSEDGTTCRVRLLGSDGLPTGEVRTGVKFLPDADVQELVRQYAALFQNLSDQEMDKAAKQNLCYNNHDPVVIE